MVTVRLVQCLAAGKLTVESKSSMPRGLQYAGLLLENDVVLVNTAAPPTPSIIMRVSISIFPAMWASNAGHCTTKHLSLRTAYWQEDITEFAG